jgi:uncharacterized membrane protein YhaH (DUF805 family)
MDPNAVIEVFRRNITEHFFDTKGRVRRQEFWYFVLASVVVNIAAAIIDAVVGTHILRAVVGLALLLPSLGLGIRRLQDTGRNGTLVWIWAGLYAVLMVLTIISGLFLFGAAASPYGIYALSATAIMFAGLVSLVGLITLVVAIVLIYFWAQPGTVGENQYGPDPKAAA